MRAGTWIAALALLGCIGRTPLAEQEDAGVEGCIDDADCPGGWCTGPPACGAVWTCVDEVPCSAAAPSWVCGCDGTIFSAAAGCPQRQYAWTDSGSTLQALDGEPCDPADPDGFRTDVVLRGTGFEAHGGEQAQARIFDPSTERFAAEWRTDIEDGGFVFEWPAGLRARVDQTIVEVFLVDEVGACRPTFAWRLEVTRGADPIVLDVRPDRPPVAEVCD